MEPIRIIENPTTEAGDILVVFDDNGTLVNQHVQDEAIAEELAATPVTLPNPEYVTLSEDLSQARKAADEATAYVWKISDALVLMSSTLPNPDRAVVEQKAFAAAEKLINA